MRIHFVKQFVCLFTGTLLQRQALVGEGACLENAVRVPRSHVASSPSAAPLGCSASGFGVYLRGSDYLRFCSRVILRS